MDNNIYVIDACSLIEASKRYHLNKKTFKSIWEKFAEMFENGQLISSIEIFDELQDDDLREWVKAYKKCFKPLSQEVQANVTKILKDNSGIINVKNTKKSSSNGDPFLIATAMCENGQTIVVTEERSTKEFGVPKICSQYGIPSINLDAFLKEILE